MGESAHSKAACTRGVQLWPGMRRVVPRAGCCTSDTRGDTLPAEPAAAPTLCWCVAVEMKLGELICTRGPTPATRARLLAALSVLAATLRHCSAKHVRCCPAW